MGIGGCSGVMRWGYGVCSLVGIGAALLAPSVASANPRPLPFSYPYETLGEGELEVEQITDIVPLYIRDGEATILEPRFDLTTEIEYGVTDRLELGLYFALKNDPGEALGFDGVKQRLRYRIGREGDLPIDTTLYFEVAELHDEIELEEKIILQKRFGALKAVANLWVAQAFERGGEIALEVHPTAGLTYQLHPRATLGLEYWMTAEFVLAEPAEEEGEPEDEAAEEQEEWNHAPHHFLGPTVSLQWDKLWWSTGVYLRLDDFSRTLRPGDAFGRAWVRTSIGLSF